MGFDIIIKSSKPALALCGEHTQNYINPSGKFISDGPQGDESSEPVIRLNRILHVDPEDMDVGSGDQVMVADESCGSRCGKLTADDITNIFKVEFTTSVR